MTLSRWPRGVGPPLLLGVPFVMLAWLAPFVSSRTIGKDYPAFAISDQLELMWSVRTGTFPLYLPGFAFGHSSAAATLGQLYHPISWLAAAMPGYWSGFALEWNTFLRLLSLGLTHLVLYRFLRRLAVPPLPSFLSTFATVYNLRMLDSFRFGAALEGYVAMLLVAAAAGFVYLDEDERWPVAVLALSTYLLLVSGHPQWVCFGAAGALIFGLLVPCCARALDSAHPRPNLLRLRRYVLRLSLGGGIGVLLAAPYLLTFYFECYRTNYGRLAAPYQWTLLHAETPAGEFCNFLFPLRTAVPGAFAGSALFLLAALFPFAALVRRRAPTPLWVAYGSALAAFLFAVGDATPFHRFLLEAIPALGSFRVPGRILLLIPLFCLPLLAWMMSPANRRALLGAGVAGLSVYAWSCVHGAPAPPNALSPLSILEGQLPPWLEGVVLHLSGATLLLLVVAAAGRAPHRLALAGAGLGVVATTWLCLQHGTWQTQRRPTRTLSEITAAHRASVRAPIDPGADMEVRSLAVYSALHLNPRRPLATMVHAAEQVASEGQALARLTNRATASLLIEAPVSPFSPDVMGDSDELTLTDNTANRWRFQVLAAREGYVVLGLPWLPGFTARVDGRPAAVVRANALYPAVRVLPGVHLVEFRFLSPPFLAGLAAALLGATWLVLWLFPARRLLAFAAVVVLGGVFATWMYAALFRGPSFGSRWRLQAAAEAR